MFNIDFSNRPSAQSRHANLFGVAVLAGAMIFTSTAQAAPLGFSKAAGAAFESDLSSVRDGCGRGWRFSHRRGECVPEHGSHRFHDDRRGFHHDGSRSRNSNRDAAAAIATGAVVLGIIAAGANRNKSGNRQNNSKPNKPRP